MTWAAALSVAVLAWLPFGHMHVEPSAQLSTATITDMRGWVANQGAMSGQCAGGVGWCIS